MRLEDPRMQEMLKEFFYEPMKAANSSHPDVIQCASSFEEFLSSPFAVFGLKFAEAYYAAQTGSMVISHDRIKECRSKVMSGRCICGNRKSFGAPFCKTCRDWLPGDLSCALARMLRRPFVAAFERSEILLHGEKSRRAERATDVSKVTAAEVG